MTATFSAPNNPTTPASPPVSFIEAIDLANNTGFADAFPGPQTITIEDVEYKVIPWSTDDYAPWCLEIDKKLYDERMKSIPLNTPPDMRWKIESNIREREFTPDEISTLLFRISAQKRIIVEALTRAGVPAEAAEKYFKSRPARANEMLAILLSGLYSNNQFNATYQRTTADQTELTAKTFGGRRPLASGQSSNSSDDSEEKLTGQPTGTESSPPSTEASAA